MKIPVGNLFAEIDERDFSLVSGYTWWLSRGYAYTNINKKTVYMHRLISGAGLGMDTDHINRNRLDNRRVNLRVVTRSVNNHNKAVSSVTGHKYVYELKDHFRVRPFHVRYKRKTLGYFETASEAIAFVREALKNDRRVVW